MSKTQKIILLIGVGLLGASLVLLLVNTILKKDSTATNQSEQETSLFSLFERPVQVKNTETATEDTSNIDSEGGLTQNIPTNKNYVLLSSQPVFNFIAIEKTIDQLSFTPDTQKPVTKTKKQGIRYSDYDGIIYEKYEGEQDQRISKTVTNKLGEVFLFGDSVVYRYGREDMQTIETFIGSVSKKESDAGVINGDYLPKNIRSFALNQKTGAFASLLSDESRQSAQILIGSIGKTSRQTLLKTSFTDWLLGWLDDSHIILTSRPSGKVIGSAYIVNTSDTSKTKIASGYGLTTKTLPYGAGVAVSTVTNNTYGLDVYKDKKLNYTPLKTVADKCTAVEKNIIVCAVPISPSGLIPDDWYKGELNYRDSIIQYNVLNGSQKILLEEEGFDVDIIEPSADGLSVYYRNKNNGLIYKTKVSLDI